MRFPAFLLIVSLFVTGGAGLNTYAQTYPPASDSPVAKPRRPAPDNGPARPRYKWENPLFKEERQYLDSLKPTWNVVSIHLTQALVREVQVSYERFLRRKVSLEASLGVRIPNLNDHEVYGGMFAQNYDLNYKAYPFIRSYYGALGLKWNLVTLHERPKIPIYLAAVPFYRYNFFNDETYGVSAYSSFDNQAYWQSRHQHVAGLKAGVGFRFPVWHVDETHKFLLDLFVGVGYRHILTRATTYGIAIGNSSPAAIVPYPEPKTEKSSRSFGSIQIGAKFGFAWAR